MFRVGMKVVCVDDRPNNWSQKWIHAGGIYTISAIIEPIHDPEGLFFGLIYKDFKLIGVTKPNGFCSLRFRPAVSPNAETSFTQGAPKDSERWDNRKKVTVRERAWGCSAELSRGMNCSVR